MKFKRIISGLLSSCILLNTQVYSFAGDISDRYETFKSDEITVKDILEEDSLDIKIEGNTIVNVLGDITSIGNPSAIDVDNESNSITFTHEQENTTVRTKVFYGNSLVEINKTYTFIFNIVENTLVNGSAQSVAKFNVVNFNKGTYMIKPGDVGLYKVLLEQPDTTTHEGKPYFEVHDNSIGKLVIKDMMLIEGDYTDKDIPYFEGMKSSFEDNLVTQDMVDNGLEDKKNLGKYKAEIKTTGKNLFDISVWKNNPILDSSYGTVVWNDDVNAFSITSKVNDCYTNTGVVTAGHTVLENLQKFAIKVKPDTTYTISFDSINPENLKTNSYISLLDKNYTYKSLLNLYNGVSFTTTSDTEYITLRFGVNGADINRVGDTITYSNIQIEENNKKTDYEEYKENINTFYLNSPLLKGDTIESINGEFYHVKRSKNITLNGSENWVAFRDTSELSQGNTAYAAIKLEDLHANNDEINLVTDKFISVPGNKFDYNKEMIYSWNWDYGNHFYLHIYLNKLETIDVQGFKKYLKDNPINVVYDLIEPIYEPIRVDLKVGLLKGTTYVFNNSYVPSNMEITVDRTANRAIEAVEAAKLSPTVENMAIARMWINLLKESTLKDDFQDIVSDITNISGLELEKKKVSANLDMYIKPENSMSMSLSTNSITFDNYTGLEDMEKLGALDITINSSLPYSLNAYIPKELSNPDGSSSMGVNLLNIRDNTESSYSQFINTTDKVVLKSGCDKGNNKVHTIDLKLASDRSFKPDIYKAVIKFEAEQK